MESTSDENEQPNNCTDNSTAHVAEGILDARGTDGAKQSWKKEESSCLMKKNKNKVSILKKYHVFAPMGRFQLELIYR